MQSKLLTLNTFSFCMTGCSSSMINHKNMFSHLEPLDLSISSGHLTLKRSLLLLWGFDILHGFRDHSRRFYKNPNTNKHNLQITAATSISTQLD